MAKKSRIYDAANMAVYLFRRNSWLIDPTWFFKKYDRNLIDRPIFLLGNQGGGLTLVSRMLRRDPTTVSVSGGGHYWAGADELQNVFGPVLPAALTGIKYKAPEHPVLSAPRSWSYAVDEVLPLYRKTARDATPEMKAVLEKVLSYVICRYGGQRNVRFIDKSQVFTVKLSLVYDLLREFSPRFVLITRDPFAECPRAASGKAADMLRYKQFLNWHQRLTLCSQHWANSIRSVFQDRDEYGIRIKVCRFEDILSDPHTYLNQLCEFMELDFKPEMIPQKGDKLPFGVRFGDRWYPLRKDVNQQYIRQLKEPEIELIQKSCSSLAEDLGYTPPQF